ncbi:hypothetical protein VCRA2110O318_90150 [Vibrio crassostreae]|nr:hypothetical protein VCRA2117O328_100151 [Vibrio crassostreae]CAK2366760.1 hypothetical protein VCRA2110O318_90150 [Vibrio crassostreae]CAK3061343.1 hypothetical protein VCRA217O317_90150 [Vibrio crassostreae]
MFHCFLYLASTLCSYRLYLWRGVLANYVYAYLFWVPDTQESNQLVSVSVFRIPYSEKTKTPLNMSGVCFLTEF